MTYDEALKLLQLQQGYTESEKRAAYRRLAKKYHPDVNSSAAAALVMQKLNEAVAYLDTHKANVSGVGTGNLKFTHRSLFDITVVQ